jgi:hypothetical protein
LACNATAGSRVRIDQDDLVVWNTVLAIEGDLREIESSAVPLSDLVDYIALVPVVDVLRMYGEDQTYQHCCFRRLHILLALEQQW